MSCADKAQKLAWEVHFSDSSLASSARVVESTIYQGGCPEGIPARDAGVSGTDAGTLPGASPPIVYEAILVLDDPSAPAPVRPPTLDPGTYGFAAVTLDAGCVRFAAGCTAVTLPVKLDGPLVTTVSGVMGGPACPASECDNGICSGIFDAGVDAPPSDSGPLPDTLLPMPCPAGMGDCNRDPRDGCEVDLTTSLEHCGACNSECVLAHATSQCQAGICELASCDGAWGDCDGAAASGCERPLSTEASCGGTCATAAPCDLPHAEESCTAGVCQLDACHPGWEDCDASPGCETDLSDPSSCGACANVCDPAGATPLCGPAGDGTYTCVAVCPAGTSQSGNTCFDPDSDIRHCGGFGTVCDPPHATPTCSGGTCQVGACEAQWADCTGGVGDGCETALTTETDCGSCGASCPFDTGTSLRSCEDATCSIDHCFGDREDCDSDPANDCEADLLSADTCGSCDVTCSGAEPLCGLTTERARVCLASCADPAASACGDRCIDTANDLENCGDCARVCALENAAEICFEGQCLVAACDPGTDNCDGVQSNGCETPITDNPEHCGGCNMACTTPDHATAACNGTDCGFTCMAGWDDCDDDPGNGCETDLTDLADCGQCGNNCDDLPNTTATTCNGTTCEVATCEAGFADCVGVSPGCETNILTDNNNCGGCGAAGQRCVGQEDCCNGVCQTSCP